MDTCRCRLLARHNQGRRVAKAKLTAYSSHTRVTGHTASSACVTGAVLISVGAALNVAGTCLTAATACDVALSRIGDQLAAGSGWTAAVRSVDAGTGVGVAGALESPVGEKASSPVKVGRSGVGVTVQGEWSVEREDDGSISSRGLRLVEAVVWSISVLVEVPVVVQEHLPLVVHHLAHSDRFLYGSNALSVVVWPGR